MGSDIIAPITEQKTTHRDVSADISKRLKEAEDLERLVETLKEQNDAAQEALRQQNQELDALRALELTENALEARERALDKAEEAFNLKKELHDLAITHANARVTDHQKMVELIFRNTTLRKNWNQPVAVEGGQFYDNVNQTALNQGGYVSQGTGDSFETEE